MAFSFGKPAASTSSLFGQQQPAQQQQQPQQQSNPFGGSLFGGASNPASTSAAAPSLSLFGSSAPSTSTGTGLFGSSTTTAAPSLFGTQSATTTQQPQQQQQQQQQQQPQPLFGQSQLAASSSLFGPKAPLASSATQPAQQQSLPRLGEGPLPNPNEPSIESRIEAIKDSWDPQHPKCRFTTFFYNEPVPPSTVRSYGRPAHVDERSWYKAVRENPDPDRLVPALASGFGALERRIDAQDRASAQHEALLEQIHAHLEQLNSTHSLETSLRIMRARKEATAQRARLVELVARSSRLSPLRNSPVRKEEDELRVELERLAKRGEHVRGQTNEIWARIGTLNNHHKGKSASSEGASGEGWTVVDEQSFRHVLDILSTQQNGLDHLTKLLNDATRDVRVMQEAFGTLPSS